MLVKDCQNLFDIIQQLQVNGLFVLLHVAWLSQLQLYFFNIPLKICVEHWLLGLRPRVPSRVGNVTHACLSLLITCLS